MLDPGFDDFPGSTGPEQPVGEQEIAAFRPSASEDAVSCNVGLDSAPPSLGK